MFAVPIITWYQIWYHSSFYGGLLCSCDFRSVTHMIHCQRDWIRASTIHYRLKALFSVRQLPCPYLTSALIEDFTAWDGMSSRISMLCLMHFDLVSLNPLSLGDQMVLLSTYLAYAAQPTHGCTTGVVHVPNNGKGSNPIPSRSGRAQ